MKKKGIEVVVLEPTLENELPLNFQSIEGSVFDTNKANKNARYGGGIGTWGNALTQPTRESYFSNPKFNKWRTVEKYVLDERALSYFSKVKPDSFKLNKAEARLLNHYLPGIASAFRIEKHAYAGKTPLSNGWKLQIDPIAIIRGIIIRIEKSSGGNLYSVTYRDHQGRIHEVKADKVIFASGALMNAALVSLLVGKTLFPIGNHASLKLFELRFKRMQSLGNLIQNFSRTSSSFLSFTYPKNKSKLNEDLPEVSIRINYKDKESVRSIFNPGSRNIRDRFEIFIRFMAERILKIHLYRVISIFAWVEMQIETSNFMRIENVENGIFHVTIRMFPSQLIQNQVQNAQNCFKKYLTKSHFDLPKIDNHQGVVNLTPWVDTAHYFGTVPMHNFKHVRGLSEKSQFCTVSNNFELNGYPGIYVIGNSSIPQGGHGHPTAMTVSLANVFVQRVLND
jgi:hypothetical protein